MTYHKSDSRKNQIGFFIFMVSSELCFSTYADWQALSYWRVIYPRAERDDFSALQ